MLQPFAEIDEFLVLMKSKTNNNEYYGNSCIVYSVPWTPYRNFTQANHIVEVFIYKANLVTRHSANRWARYVFPVPVDPLSIILRCSNSSFKYLCSMDLGMSVSNAKRSTLPSRLPTVCYKTVCSNWGWRQNSLYNIILYVARFKLNRESVDSLTG